VNWENEFQRNIKARIDRLSPNLSGQSRVQSVDAIILEEAEKLQDKYSTVYNASNNILASIFSPGVHDKFAPLYTEYPTEETEVKHPLVETGIDGLFKGFLAGLTYEASKGISYENTGEAVTEGAGKVIELLMDLSRRENSFRSRNLYFTHNRVSFILGR